MNESSVKLRAIAPQFVVPDVVRAAEYYRDSLGFKILGYWLDPPVFAIVQGLFDLVKHSARLKDDLELTLGQLEKQDIPSLKARIRKLRGLNR